MFNIYCNSYKVLSIYTFFNVKVKLQYFMFYVSNIKFLGLKFQLSTTILPCISLTDNASHSTPEEGRNGRKAANKQQNRETKLGQGGGAHHGQRPTNKQHLKVKVLVTPVL